MPVKPFFILALFLAITICSSWSVEGIRVQSLEKQITQAAQMNFSSYKLYPFAINTDQQFILHFVKGQNVKGEVRVNWIDVTKNQLAYPTYDPKQLIRLRIVDSLTNKVVQERKFHFQTGINFMAEANHRYKMVFTNIGEQSKMVELSLSHIEPIRISELASNNFTSTTEKTNCIGRQIQSELNNLTLQTQRSQMSIKNIYAYLTNNLSQYLIFSAWEIFLVAVMMGCQIILFRNLIKNYGIFV